MTDKRIDYMDWLNEVRELASKYDLTDSRTCEVLIDCALSIGCDDYRALALYFAGQMRQIGQFEKEHPGPDERWAVVVEYDTTRAAADASAGPQGEGRYDPRPPSTTDHPRRARHAREGRQERRGRGR